MLTGKQKRFLRSKANHLQPLFQIGKNGLTDAVIDSIEEALEAKELIKVNILQNCDEDKNEIAEKLAEREGIELVQVIGNIIVLYKESVEKKRIELPLQKRSKECPMKKVGILGGTFNPPHLGHLLIGNEVRQALGLDEVRLMPTATPPHKTAIR